MIIILILKLYLGLVHEGGKTFGVYAVSITRVYMSGKEENWHVYKRYSDFYDLYQRVKERVRFKKVDLIFVFCKGLNIKYFLPVFRVR